MQYNLISGFECSKSANEANAVIKSRPTDKKKGVKCLKKKQEKLIHLN